MATDCGQLQSLSEQSRLEKSSGFTVDGLGQRDLGLSIEEPNANLMIIWSVNSVNSGDQYLGQFSAPEQARLHVHT